MPKPAPVETPQHLAMTAAIASLAGAAAVAQYRPNQPEMTKSPVDQPRAVPPHTPEEFKAAYCAAGQPRVALFWNVTFDDATEMERQNTDQPRTFRSQSSIGLDKATSGAASASTLRERDQRSRDEVARTIGRTVDSAKRPVPFSMVTAVELETAFRGQLQIAAVRLVNRDFNIRLTHGHLEADSQGGLSVGYQKRSGRWFNGVLYHSEGARC